MFTYIKSCDSLVLWTLFQGLHLEAIPVLQYFRACWSQCTDLCDQEESFREKASAWDMGLDSVTFQPLQTWNYLFTCSSIGCTRLWCQELFFVIFPLVSEFKISKKKVSCYYFLKENYKACLNCSPLFSMEENWIECVWSGDLYGTFHWTVYISWYFLVLWVISY